MASEPLMNLHGVAVLVCPPDGQKLRGEGDATDLIGEALQHGAELVLVPVERFTDEFFKLSTGVAGGIVQKFVNYRLRLAIVGDISAHVAKSSALRDFVYETNRGRQFWFVASSEELDERLQRGRPAAA